jgi:hypothetical protein
VCVRQCVLLLLTHSAAVFVEDSISNHSQPPYSSGLLRITLGVLVSKVVILLPKKKFDRTQQHVSQPYQKRIFRGACSSGRTTGASVYVQKGSSLRVIRLGFIHIFFPADYV